MILEAHFFLVRRTSGNLFVVRRATLELSERDQKKKTTIPALPKSVAGKKTNYRLLMGVF